VELQHTSCPDRGGGGGASGECGFQNNKLIYDIPAELFVSRSKVGTSMRRWAWVRSHRRGIFWMPVRLSPTCLECVDCETRLRNRLSKLASFCRGNRQYICPFVLRGTGLRRGCVLTTEPLVQEEEVGVSNSKDRFRAPKAFKSSMTPRPPARSLRVVSTLRLCRYGVRPQQFHPCAAGEE
jgi:hypothetical protein